MRTRRRNNCFLHRWPIVRNSRVNGSDRLRSRQELFERRFMSDHNKFLTASLNFLSNFASATATIQALQSFSDERSCDDSATGSADCVWIGIISLAGVYLIVCF
jgi:hypothetical protein